MELKRAVITGLGAISPIGIGISEINKSLSEGIASSPTEIYAPAIHQERIAGQSKHYEWADDYALAYFKKRINQARKDVDFGREWVINNAKTRSDQEAVLNAVKFKTEVLWAQLDALYHAYVEPGNIPPGCFIPTDYKLKNVKK